MKDNDNDQQISPDRQKKIADKAAARRSRGKKSDYIVIAILVAALMIVIFTLEQYI